MRKSMLKALLCENRPGVGTLTEACSVAVNRVCCAEAGSVVKRQSNVGRITVRSRVYGFLIREGLLIIVFGSCAGTGGVGVP